MDVSTCLPLVALVFRFDKSLVGRERSCRNTIISMLRATLDLRIACVSFW